MDCTQCGQIMKDSDGDVCMSCKIEILKQKASKEIAKNNKQRIKEYKEKKKGMKEKIKEAECHLLLAKNGTSSLSLMS